MRVALQFVYGIIVIVVMAFLARTCFGVGAPDVSKQAVPAAKSTTAASAVTERPPDADRYANRPQDELLASDSLSKAMFDELSARYQPALAEFKRAADAAGAKLIVISFGVDNGKSKSELERRGEPVIMAATKALQIPCYDFSAALDSATAAGAHILVDAAGHLSRDGAAVVATGLAGVVQEFGAYRSTKTFTAAERPLTFGDYRPREDDVVDLGNGHPYMLKVNSQGLRMSYDLPFPKTKQRIFLMGSSLAYFQFLDNDKTSTALLQAKFPDKEIANAGMVAYSIRDELDLFVEKTQFAEPDVILLQQNGNDIIRLFFTSRNYQDRAKRYQAPSPLEKAWYLAHYPTK